MGSLRNVVVTIPVYFSKSQIAATILSCEKAGLNVLRTIKESQAIAMGLFHQNTDKEDRNVLVINLGGGSLDIAIITIQEQLFEVKAMHGDTTLGGVDFVKRLMDYCQYEYRENQQENIIDNWGALELLRMQCEKAKKILITETEAKIYIPKLSNNKDLSLVITR